MNRQGQAGIVGFILYLGVFILLWAFFIADLLTWVGSNALASGQLSGLELFFMANLNLVVFIGVTVAIGAFTALGGSQ